MKYLKKFNESYKIEELKEFCEELLVDILDMGGTLHIVDGELYGSPSDGNFFNGYTIEIFILSKWCHIKGTIIKFIEFLESEYSIINLTNIQKRKRKLITDDVIPYIKFGSYFIKIDDILNDRIDDDRGMVSITIQIKK